MAVRVLVVDDSGFFRRRVTEILETDPGIKVIGAAENGEQAVSQAKSLSPDVITMDIEMPVLDGISATRQIMQSSPTRIIMFSSLTTDGAKSTLDALDAGAMDFLPKRFEDISSDREEAKKLLCEKVKQLARQRLTNSTVADKRIGRNEEHLSAGSTRRKPAVTANRAPQTFKKQGGIDIVAIGTSTGGPVALQEVLTQIPATFPVPIVLVQHMPASFTLAFAQRLNAQCQLSVKQAEDGDILKPGCAYLAPGGQQMVLTKKGPTTVIKITEADSSQTYKPSVDITFSSLVNIFPSRTLAIILTGMGADGCKGATELHKAGSAIWAQDEDSCVVYGMPAAVANAGITERVLNLKDIGVSITKRV